MANSADNIINFVIGIILIVGGIVSTLVVIYPRLSFDEKSRYVQPDRNETVLPESLIQPNDSKYTLQMFMPNYVFNRIVITLPTIQHLKTCLLTKKSYQSK